MNPAAQFIEAARFLTRAPLPSTGDKSITLSDAFMMFPMVGALIGAFSGLVMWAGLALGLPPLPAAIIAVGATVFLTGALHEDGLGDVADGFGGGKNVAEKLTIMRDSRLGTYGVLCLVLAVAARLGALAGLAEVLSPLAVLFILIAAAALSRGLMVGIIATLPAARTEGLSATLRVRRPVALMTGALCLTIVLAALLPVLSMSGVLISLISATFATVILAVVAFRQIGGHTGDVAGAAQQIAEIACLFAVIAQV